MVTFIVDHYYCICNLLGFIWREETTGDIKKMNLIKSIFEHTEDEQAHRQFRRFSKGTFESRAVVELNVGKDLKVKTSFEYTNGFVRLFANTITTPTHLTGGIITSQDLTGKLGFEFADKKQFAGVKTYLFDTDVTKEQLLHVLDTYPDAVFCLSFSTEYGSLSVKVKNPKSAKPGKAEAEDVKADYCKIVTSDLNFKHEFAFDVTEPFKKFRVLHDFIITELVVPEQYKHDFLLARIHAKRKGKIVRTITLDGKIITKEIDFEV